MEKFFEVYREELAKAVVEHPDEYGWPLTELDIVVGRMRAAVLRGSYNKDGRAFKGTCKRLGIKYTYAAMDSYLGLTR